VLPRPSRSRLEALGAAERTGAQLSKLRATWTGEAEEQRDALQAAASSTAALRREARALVMQMQAQHAASVPPQRAAAASSSAVALSSERVAGAAEVRALGLESEQRLEALAGEHEAWRRDAELTLARCEQGAEVVLRAVASELADEERCARCASHAAHERAAELAMEQEATAGLRAENARLRDELSTLIEVQQTQQGSAAAQSSMHLKAALAQAEEGLAWQQEAYKGRIDELEEMVQVAEAKAARQADEAEQAAAAQHEAAKAIKAARHAVGGAASGAAGGAATALRAAEARADEAEERALAEEAAAEEAEEVVCAARAEMAELRADLDVSRGEQASSTRTGRDHTDRRERRETPLPPPSPAVPDPDPSP